MNTLWNQHPDALLEALQAAQIRRAYIITDPQSGAPRASHPALDEIAATIAADARDYHGHAGIFLEIGEESGHLLSACVHKTKRGQAAGGVRFWVYETVEGFIRDGLRLSRGMGHKNALAGLWWGGGKGVIARRAGVDFTDPEVRRAVYRDYGRFMSGLRGCYVTAEDAGTTAADMAEIYTMTRHTTCIPPALGGSGNPSDLTATGVVVAMEAALAWRGLGALEGKAVALQGLGHVSRAMIGELLKRGVARIIGTDVDARALEMTRRMYLDAPLELREVPLGDMSALAERVDIVAPNAIGAILNPTTIPTIKAPIVCGAANNQLADPSDGARLLAQGVLYVPDFLANRMGIVNCANEQYGVLPEDPAILAHLARETPTGVYQRALEVFERAAANERSPADEAVALADELAEVPHPIWGDRGAQIIAALVAEGWAEG
ncbi:hypothetical protein KKF91_15795 [Myxococcota bacterium]|nr:hypothetical protein [Myxococcota bacterium]MBU1432004.1 hypothetical protein [Myxococcota bacterium]MBU1896178.1 hypothetical protein [Myxococcota bacterium]